RRALPQPHRLRDRGQRHPGPRPPEPGDRRGGPSGPGCRRHRADRAGPRDASRRVLVPDPMRLPGRDRPPSRYTLRAVSGSALGGIGLAIAPGEGLAGRAIRDRALVVDRRFDPMSSPLYVPAGRATSTATEASEVAGSSDATGGATVAAATT